jgi:hypothetical protein
MAARFGIEGNRMRASKDQFPQTATSFLQILVLVIAEESAQDLHKVVSVAGRWVVYSHHLAGPGLDQISPPYAKAAYFEEWP